MPFFPRVDVGLVGLDHRVAQRVAVEPDPGVLLEAVSKLQQVLAVAPQFASHLRRGRRLGDAVEDHQQHPRPAMGPLEDGPGPGVEDAAAGLALIVQHRGAVAAVDSQALPLATAGAGEAVGVEQVEELGVAGVLIEVVDQGEVHGRGPVCEGRSESTRAPTRPTVKRRGTSFAS